MIMINKNNTNIKRQRIWRLGNVEIAKKQKSKQKKRERDEKKKKQNNRTKRKTFIFISLLSREAVIICN